MLKHILLSAMLVTLGMSAPCARQQEAALLQVELPGAGFNIVVAVPKLPSTPIDLGESPDALVVHLVGGELALHFEDGTKMLEAVEYLRRPACAFKTESDGRKANDALALYVVPAHKAPAHVRTVSFDGRPPAVMRRVDVKGTDFAIVFATTTPPIAWEPHEHSDSIAIHSGGTELFMATDEDVKRMFNDVGLSRWPLCAFYVEHKGGSLPGAASVYVVPK